MKKLLCATVALAALAASQTTFGADSEQPSPAASSSGAQPGKVEPLGVKEHHPWTLDEARKHAHDYSARLDKMTPEEWDAMLKKREMRMQKWKSMHTIRQKNPRKSPKPHKQAQ